MNSCPDILDQIADTLDAVEAGGPQKCACGCRRTLRTDGPSFYFATQDCQERWQNTQADGVAEIAARPDAAGFPPSRFLDDRPDQPAYTYTMAMSHADPHLLEYRRRCGHCDRAVIPQIATVFSTSGEPASIRHRCPDCQRELPDPAYLPTVLVAGDYFILELADGISRARRRISRRELLRYQQAQQLVDYVWNILESDVDRFRRTWYGQMRRGGSDSHRIDSLMYAYDSIARWRRR